MCIYLAIQQVDVAPREKYGPIRVRAIIQLQTLTIDTRSMQIDTTFNLTLSWYDSRIMLYNLKEKITSNHVHGNETVWNPRVGFSNTLDHATTVTDDKMSLFAKQQKTDSSVDNDVPEESKYYVCSMIESNSPN